MLHLSRGHVPDAQLFGPFTGKERGTVATKTPVRGVKVRVAMAKLAADFAGGGVPDQDRAVVGGRGDRATVGQKRQAINRFPVSVQGQPRLAAGDIPDVDPLVPVRERNEATIRRKSS